MATDGGGPTVRHKERNSEVQSFLFPQMQSRRTSAPNLACVRWRPRFVDYLLCLHTEFYIRPDRLAAAGAVGKSPAMIQILNFLTIVVLLISRASASCEAARRLIIGRFLPSRTAFPISYAWLHAAFFCCIGNNIGRVKSDPDYFAFARCDRDRRRARIDGNRWSVFRMNAISRRKQGRGRGSRIVQFIMLAWRVVKSTNGASYAA